MDGGGGTSIPDEFEDNDGSVRAVKMPKPPTPSTPSSPIVHTHRRIVRRASSWISNVLREITGSHDDIVLVACAALHLLVLCRASMTIVVALFLSSNTKKIRFNRLPRCRRTE